MKILFISPDIEEKARGINVILKSMMFSASELGHEVGLLTSYPRRSKFKANDQIATKLENRYLQDYLTQGRSSYSTLVRGGYSKLNILISLINLSFFRTKYLTHDKKYFSDQNSIAATLDFTINSPYIYQFMVRNKKFLSRLMLRRISRKYDFDVIIVPAPSILDRSYVGDKQLIHFIHDLMPLDLSETPMDMNTPKRFARQIHSTIENSDMLLANSEDTKAKILEIQKQANVHVLYGTASSDGKQLAQTKVLERLKIQKGKYLLFTSTVEARKNIERLIDAHQIVFEDTGLSLVIIGGDGWGSEQIKAKHEDLNQDLKKHIIFTGFISEEDKYTLFKNAKLFVFPSITEGIGLILMEAMEMGIPIVTSRRGALPESAGEAASYIEDPYDTSEISAKILELLGDEEKQSQLIEKGHQQVKKFTYDKFKERFKKALAEFK